MYENLALSESGFLFDTRSGATFTLSTTGTFLLRLLMDGADPESLPTRLRDDYEVEREVAHRDVSQFIFRLRDLGLIGKRDEDGGQR